ncbi:MAG: MFS transporter [Thermomicrobiales bacterium]
MSSSSGGTPGSATARPLWALLGASGISLIGNQLTALAIPWFVLATTGSAVLTGLAGVAAVLPAVLAAFLGGAVVDRLGPKRTSVLADLLSGLAVAMIPLLYRSVGLPFAVLLVLVFLGALLDTPGVTARQALLPEVATGARVSLERANGAYHSLENLAGLAGPLLAGVLVAVIGATNVLWVDAASFAISAALVARAVPALVPATEERASGGYLADVTLGWQILRRDRFLRAMTAAAVVLNFLGAPLFGVILPVYGERIYGSAAALGILLASFGLGMLAGSLLFSLRGEQLPRRGLLLGGLVLTALPLAALVALPPLPVAAAALGLAGLGSGPINPLVFTVLQERVPADMRGRVFGTILGTALAAAPLGMAAAGFLVETLGLRTVLAIVAGGFLAVAVFALVAPGFRSLDTPAAGEVEPAAVVDG